MNAVGREGEADAPRAFAPSQMTACAACDRRSAPTRMNCIYCGTQLPAPAGGADLRRPALRPLEDWERGTNVILVCEEESGGGAPAELCEEAIAEAAALVRVEAGELRQFLAARVPLPLARTADAEEAALLGRRLGALGLRVGLVADEELAIESLPPRRVRGLAFDAEGLTGRAAGGGEERAAWGDIELIVTGRISERRMEAEVERKRVRGGVDEAAAESRELSADEAVVDLYFAGRPGNWRVGSDGFDFSCLGADKALLAAENFARLASLLRAHAVNARFNDSYARLRRLLKYAWPPAERAVSAGLRRARPGLLRAGAATVVSDESQFTRYGRLLRHCTIQRDITT